MQKFKMLFFFANQNALGQLDYKFLCSSIPPERTDRSVKTSHRCLDDLRDGMRLKVVWKMKVSFIFLPKNLSYIAKMVLTNQIAGLSDH